MSSSTSAAAVSFREAEASDADAIAELHARSWRESYRGSFRDSFLDGPVFEERLEVWKARLTRPPPRQIVSVAVDGEDLLGFVCAYSAHDPTWGSFIDNLHVSGKAKRRGLGTALMRRAATLLAVEHADLGVHLFVLTANVPARRFYERLGASDAGGFTADAHGGGQVQSRRYVWSSPRALATS